MSLPLSSQPGGMNRCLKGYISERRVESTAETEGAAAGARRDGRPQVCLGGGWIVPQGLWESGKNYSSGISWMVFRAPSPSQVYQNHFVESSAIPSQNSSFHLGVIRQGSRQEGRLTGHLVFSLLVKWQTGLEAGRAYISENLKWGESGGVWEET